MGLMAVFLLLGVFNALVARLVEFRTWPNLMIRLPPIGRVEVVKIIIKELLIYA